MKTNDFPDIYVAADQEAAKKQSLYFRLLVAQYFSLFVASALTLLTIGMVGQKQILGAYLAALVAGSIAALLLATVKPHQHWYQMRALAESCKTLAWRYMMSSEPFGADTDDADASALLADRMHELVTIQNLNTSALVANLNPGDQATATMKAMRGSSYEERRSKYLELRIDDQLNWYQSKARRNTRASAWASGIVVLVFVAAILAALLQFQFDLLPNTVVWVSEPLLVLAASFLGYAQAKRFAELSSSYALTALEIQKLRARFLAVKSEEEFTAYVNEAETAFSREHTQWIARVV